MSAHAVTLGCLIHTFQLSRDWKMWDSVQFYHSEAVYHSHRGTNRMREIDLSDCKHLFSSLISTSNEGHNIADPPFRVFSICIIVAQPCSSTHRIKERQTIFFSSLVLSTWVHNNSFYNSSENGPWNNCWVLTDVNAYSKYCQEALPRHCQHLSVNMFRSCLPATVKSCQS